MPQSCVLTLVYMRQDLATVLWAHARMGQRNTRLIHALLLRFLHPVTLRKARPRDLASILWALAELNFRDAAAIGTTRPASSVTAL